MPELILGTAQLGQPYGIMNNQIKALHKEAILDLFTMHQGPFLLLDTAPCYGTSESIIGQYILDHQLKPRVISKSLTCYPEAIRASCQASLSQLNLSHFYGFLDHNAQALLSSSGNEAYHAFCEIKEKGLAKYIGASIYDCDEIDRLMNRYKLDIIQLPINILDQRLLRSGHIRKLYDHNIQIHVRSIFLQGILLAPIDIIPASLRGLIPFIDALEKEAYYYKVTRLDILLDFIFSINMIDYIVIGVASAKELKEILQFQPLQICDNASRFALYNPQLVDPRQWTMKT